MENIHPIFDQMLQREDRAQLLGQRSKVLWLTGLSGSGKSTIALALEKKLYSAGFLAQVLDGDNIRSGINSNLTFTQEDRMENIRRIAEIAKLYLHTGVITINSFVSPTVSIRGLARDIVGSEDFIEIYVNTSLEVCEERDVKGLYEKARAGLLKNFTGIDSPYEAPSAPELEIVTADRSVEECAEEIFEYLMPQVTMQN